MMNPVQVMSLMSVLTGIVVLFATYASFSRGKVVTIRDTVEEQYVELVKKNRANVDLVNVLTTENEQLRQYVTVLENRVQELAGTTQENHSVSGAYKVSYI